MTLEQELRYTFTEDKKQGIELGITQGMAIGVKSAKLDSAVIAVKELGVPVESVAEKFGISVEEIRKHL